MISIKTGILAPFQQYFLCIPNDSGRKPKGRTAMMKSIALFAWHCDYLGTSGSLSSLWRSSVNFNSVCICHVCTFKVKITLQIAFQISSKTKVM